jgi:hypothetical protein
MQAILTSRRRRPYDAGDALEGKNRRMLRRPNYLGADDVLNLAQPAAPAALVKSAVRAALMLHAAVAKSQRVRAVADPLRTIGAFVRRRYKTCRRGDPTREDFDARPQRPSSIDSMPPHGWTRT